ncbi:MAG TPA: hypothetical protein PK052_01370 [Anaerohalosphaeraceae bacterium]|nr:hypothetical protein [Phycisphaerae bacterium]HOK94682.1 hypothetical protein [Anaerohalosphaeraceae bacterium]HOL30606.1 hypothetical protein [Anaerohalosphaeraceae bacterium]HOM77121.1 hypothetical protein [Anaerohalosphaeraceae bacterium]HPC63129.1 hypothetical protein [Anaerohalosphaeraceae bacterium]
MKNFPAAQWMLCMAAFGILVLSAAAQDESKPKEPPQPASGETKSREITSDIWHEISLESDDIKLTEKKVQEILEELKKSSPQQAEQLAALRQSDPSKFIDAIREEIRKHTQSEKPAAGTEDKSSQWKEQLERRHELFLEWFQKGYANEFGELVKLRESNPEKYVQRVLDLMKVYEPIQRAERISPELASVMKKELELQKQQDELLVQIRLAAKDQQPKLTEELKRLVSTQFDAIVSEKQIRCELLRKRLESLTQQLEAQAAELELLKKNKSQTVEDRIKELIERNEKINWD